MTFIHVDLMHGVCSAAEHRVAIAVILMSETNAVLLINDERVVAAIGRDQISG